jgi:ribosomal protein L16/L10AE
MFNLGSHTLTFMQHSLRGNTMFSDGNRHIYYPLQISSWKEMNNWFSQGAMEVCRVCFSQQVFMQMVTNEGGSKITCHNLTAMKKYSSGRCNMAFARISFGAEILESCRVFMAKYLDKMPWITENYHSFFQIKSFWFTTPLVYMVG